MNIEIKKEWKSIKSGKAFVLPDFTVLTGKNGSGKTHLLEVLTQNTHAVITTDDGLTLQNIKYIPFNGLNPQIVDTSTYNDIISRKEREWKILHKQIEEVNKHWDGDVHNYLYNVINIKKEEIQRYLGHWYKKANNDITKLTEEFVYENFEICSDEILSSQFATIFKLYYINLEENYYHAYLNANRNGHYKVLTNDEFEKKYGPKPWILINSMLQKAGLSYKVNDPEGTSREESFNLKLTDVNTGIEIKVADLSTGEKVLMSLALAIYNTKENGTRPDILLLDEPDAPLHPQFSKVLIESAIDSIVKTAGVKVIITTHSPSTVALAPEDSIYRMNKNTSRPEKITKLQAISILTKDIDNLRVSIENRRQIFVESKYDVEYYNKIYRLIDYPFHINPQFLAPNNTDGSNCDDVKKMTKALRDMGNDLVYGFVDSDEHYKGNDFVFPLGDGNRYAIDNYIFDPIFTAILLLQQHIVNSEEMGISPCKFTTFSELSHGDIQQTINYVVKELGLDSEPEVEYTIQNGEKFKVSSSYFHKKGHSLEDLIKNKWKKLLSISKSGGDNKLKNYVIQNIIDEYPQYLSQDFVNIMNKVK